MLGYRTGRLESAVRTYKQRLQLMQDPINPVDWERSYDLNSSNVDITAKMIFREARVLLVTGNVYWHRGCNSEAAGRWANAPWGRIRAERISEVRGTCVTCLKLSEAVEMKCSRSLTTSVASDRLFLPSDTPKVPQNTLIIPSFPTMFKLNP